MPYVWPLIEGNVYGTPLTLALLRPKLEEHGIHDRNLWRLQELVAAEIASWDREVVQPAG